MVARGKKLLVVSMTLYLSCNVYNITQGINQYVNMSMSIYLLLGGIFQFTVEGFLFILIFKGSTWARIIELIILGTINGLYGLVFFFLAIFTYSVSIGLLLMSLTATFTFIVLVSKPVKKFQERIKSDKVQLNEQNANGHK